MWVVVYVWVAVLRGAVENREDPRSAELVVVSIPK